MRPLPAPKLVHCMGGDQGDGVTKGLRKVTDDMKSKNRADRTGVVPSAAGEGPCPVHSSECPVTHHSYP